MFKLFNLDSPISSFLSDALDFIVINLLAILCALPVVTAGASYSALAGVMTSYALDQAPIRARDFFARFRAVFLRATLSWVILLAISALFLMNIRIIEGMPSALRLFFVSGMLFVSLSMLFTAAMLFPMLSFTSQPHLPTLWKSAFLIAFAKLPRTLSMAVIQGVPLFLLLILPRTFLLLSPVWVIFWFSLAAFFCARIGGRWYARS
ncbi:MAG: DUF624 domain-containing protein [Christensenella sp.]|nr:DUF624 domain-containing protein [Christensenella sp.]